MSKQRHRILTSLFFGATFLVPQIASAANMFGAIAYSEVNGVASWAVNYSSRDIAEAVALRRCSESATGCYVALWFQNACGALARGDDNVAGWSWNVDVHVAERDALKFCSDRGAHCSVIVSVCAR